MGVDPDDSDAMVRVRLTQSCDRPCGSGMVTGQHDREQPPSAAVGD